MPYGWIHHHSLKMNKIYQWRHPSNSRRREEFFNYVANLCMSLIKKYNIMLYICNYVIHSSRLYLNGNIIAWNAPFLLSMLVVKEPFFTLPFWTYCRVYNVSMDMLDSIHWFFIQYPEESNPILGTNLIRRPFLHQQLAWSLHDVQYVDFLVVSSISK